jgi:hypothetical protein
MGILPQKLRPALQTGTAGVPAKHFLSFVSNIPVILISIT